MKLSKRAGWKDNPFWFLKHHREPPTGYIHPEQFWGRGQHLPLTKLEAKFLENAYEENKISGEGVSRIDKDKLYIDLKPLVWYKNKERRVPLLDLLNIMKTENPEIIERLKNRVKEVMRKKSSYQYDLVPQGSVEGSVEGSSTFKVDLNDITKISNILKEMGVPIHAILNEREGVAYIPTHVGKTRLSRYLAKIIKKYKNTAIAEAAHKVLQAYSVTPKLKEWSLVVSAEPQDIRTMSTGRGWTSCMEGDFSTLDAAVSSRDLVAYAVAPKYDNWIARVWLRSDGKGKWWPETRVYQTGALNQKVFMNAVLSYLKDRNILGEKGQYSPEAEGWSDFLQDEIEGAVGIPEVQHGGKFQYYKVVPYQYAKKNRLGAEFYAFQKILAVALAIKFPGYFLVYTSENMAEQIEQFPEVKSVLPLAAPTAVVAKVYLDFNKVFVNTAEFFHMSLDQAQKFSNVLPPDSPVSWSSMDSYLRTRIFIPGAEIVSNESSLECLKNNLPIIYVVTSSKKQQFLSHIQPFVKKVEFEPLSKEYMVSNEINM